MSLAEVTYLSYDFIMSNLTAKLDEVKLDRMGKQRFALKFNG